MNDSDKAKIYMIIVGVWAAIIISFIVTFSGSSDKTSKTYIHTYPPTPKTNYTTQYTTPRPKLNLSTPSSIQVHAEIDYSLLTPIPTVAPTIAPAIAPSEDTKNYDYGVENEFAEFVNEYTVENINDYFAEQGIELENPEYYIDYIPEASEWFLEHVDLWDIFQDSQ